MSDPLHVWMCLWVCAEEAMIKIYIYTVFINKQRCDKHAANTLTSVLCVSTWEPANVQIWLTLDCWLLWVPGNGRIYARTYVWIYLTASALQQCTKRKVTFIMKTSNLCLVKKTLLQSSPLCNYTFPYANLFYKILNMLNQSSLRKLSKQSSDTALYGLPIGWVGLGFFHGYCCDFIFLI